jgi:hypothetical protein
MQIAQRRPPAASASLRLIWSRAKTKNLARWAMPRQLKNAVVAANR